MSLRQAAGRTSFCRRSLALRSECRPFGQRAGDTSFEMPSWSPLVPGDLTLVLSCLLHAPDTHVLLASAACLGPCDMAAVTHWALGTLRAGVGSRFSVWRQDPAQSRAVTALSERVPMSE